MPSSIDSFLALQSPNAQADSERRRKEEEAMFDKFSILFSPPTPRASPTLEASSDDIWKPSNRPIEYHELPNSPDSEFGSFVSVPASEDPLASFPSLSDIPLTPSSHSKGPSRPGHTNNPSLDFFDKFGQEAKVASERNKRGLLDELLLHEDDPFHWLKEDQSKVKGNVAPSDTNSSIIINPSAKNVGDTSAPLIDLDFDTPMSQQPKVDKHSPERSKPTHPSRHANMSSPTRSSTLSLAHTLAPPIASISPALSSPSTPEMESRSTLPTRSSSYQTLSTISSRWVSSLIPPKNATSSSSSQPSTLESLFNSSLHLRTSTVPTHTIRGAPLGDPIQHSSPFAPHVFIPPSGAPGFKGDSYDWDKGFSQQLDRELTERELSEDPSGSGHTTSSLFGSEESSVSGLPQSTSVKGTNIGSFIEKKNGSLELRGRREATVGVLNTVLADEVRSHLPALSRLPKTWNLLYSLDQHGISLNTLYTKCEAPPQLKPGSNIVSKVGALVVIKDSNDVIFGAYIGDGVRKGRGYYGSGESFLWKYERGNLIVFRWTGRNEYVALCEPGYISFGGGDGAYGLYLDESLLDGSSARCPTFDNEPLCSSGPKKGRSVTFECVGLEVWGVGP